MRCTFCLCVIAAGLAAAAAFGAEETLLLQMPAASAEHVAFVYGGDIWIVDRADLDRGGEPAGARRLTVHPGVEAWPRFSPDGGLIAFTGSYDGNADVYVVAAEGGSPRRLTYHPGPDVVRGWTPDGGSVLFQSDRLSHSRYNRLFTVSLGGGVPEALPMPWAERGCYAPDGGRIAYTPIADRFQTWKRYRGGTTPMIWIFDFETHDVQEIPHPGSNDTFPMWVGDRIYFLSDRNRIMNVFAYDVFTKDLEQVTHHDDYDVKSASAGGGVIVYDQGGRVHILQPDSSARPAAIRVNADLPHARPHFVKAGDFIGSAAISPTGKRAAVETRGEIVTVPAEKGDARNITRTPGVHERFPAWSPDGKWIAYLSDASGEYQLMLREQGGIEEPRAVHLGPATFYYQPVWSPDSKKIAYTDKRLNLWRLDVNSGEPVLVDTDTFDHPDRSLNPAWSPDSRWIAYTKRLDNHLRAVFVHDAESGESRQVTDGMSDATSPAFSRDGKYLFFAASTNVGLASAWLDMTAFERPVRRSLYLAVLSKDEPSPFRPESDEEEVKKEEVKKEEEKKEEEKKEETEEKGTPEKSSETNAEEAAEDAGEAAEDAGEAPEDAGEAPEDAGEAAEAGKEKGDSKDAAAKDGATQIDFDGLDQRILSLPVPERDYQEVRAADGDKLFYSESEQNHRGLTLHRFDMKERKGEEFLSEIGGFGVSADGKKIIYSAAGGGIGIVDTAGKPGPGGGRLKLDGVTVRVDPRAEWEQMFEEVWRIERDFFYDPGMHGADWQAVKAKYRPLLEHVGHRSDLNLVFAEMIGEMVVGHNYVGGGDYADQDDVSVGLLGADFAVNDGRYRFARIYSGENWNPDLRAPLTEPGVDVAEGDYLLAVNGRPLAAGDNVFSLFENTAGQQTVITVNSAPAEEGARQVTVVPIEGEQRLRYRAWIEDNRRTVDEMTNGRVAYVYMPDTSYGGYTSFNRYFFAQQDREAVIIDERFNGGGSAADYVIDALRRRPMNYMATREGKVQASPSATIPGPKVMIINEYAGSGGDAMPYYFRQAGLGPLVGKRTWGGLVGIYDYPRLMDGGFIAAPRIAFFSLDGEWIVENEGVAPDVEVEYTPRLVIAGRDPQLEKAVEIVLQQLPPHPAEDISVPPYPARAQ